MGNSRATSVEGEMPVGLEGANTVEPKMEHGSSRLGQIMGKSWLRYQGFCSIPGERDHLWTCWKTTQSMSSHTSPG